MTSHVYLPRQGGGWLYLVVWFDRCSRKVVGWDVRETTPEDLVAKYAALQSISRRGNCYDNAHAESFWSRSKVELLDGGHFPGLAEAKLEISHYIAYYNAERRHSALGYLALNHFETQFETTSQLSAA